MARREVYALPLLLLLLYLAHENLSGKAQTTTRVAAPRSSDEWQFTRTRRAPRAESQSHRRLRSRRLACSGRRTCGK